MFSGEIVVFNVLESEELQSTVCSSSVTLYLPCLCATLLVTPHAAVISLVELRKGHRQPRSKFKLRSMEEYIQYICPLMMDSLNGCWTPQLKNGSAEKHWLWRCSKSEVDHFCFGWLEDFVLLNTSCTSDISVRCHTKMWLSQCVGWSVL